MYDYTVIGGGILGLSVALALGQKHPEAQILILEKEPRLAFHQTGNNSGVIHSGIYYKPGSFKAKFCRQGSHSMVAFCQAHNIDHEICGKVIVATAEQELPLLENLYQRGLANGLNITKINSAQVKEIEPHVQCLAGIQVPTTGIVDYKQVCQKYLELIQAQGGQLRLNTKVETLSATNQGQVLETNNGPVEVAVGE